MPGKPVLTRDLADPAFPHGTGGGYLRGCTRDEQCSATPTCRQTRRAQHQLNEHRRVLYGTNRVQSSVVLAHITRLLAEMPLATERAIARAAGLPESAMRNLRREQVCNRATAVSVLSVKAADVEPFIAYLPVDTVRTPMGRLWAAGYPLNWIGDQVGLPHAWRLFYKGAPATLRRTIVERTLTGLAQFDNCALDPERDGIPPHIIRQSKRKAAERGYYPPAAYDDDGNLNLRLLPGHPWADADDRCGRYLEALRGYLQLHSLDSIVSDTGVNKGKVDDLRTRAGLRTELVSHTTPGARISPTGVHCVIQGDVERVKRAVTAYDEDGADPTYLCLTLGVVTLRDVPKDHPVREQIAREREGQAAAA